MSDFILGLDLGPNSIGWAMVNADEDGNPTTGFFDTSGADHPPMGSRVFEAGLQNFDTAKEQSLNQARRTARSMRRNHARRNARRKSVLKELIRSGLLPAAPAERDAIFRLDAYEVRARALDHPLQPYDIGRALYHLSQRRGFRSNRKSGKAKEDQGILLEIGELAKAIESGGYRTLGEYLHSIRSRSKASKIRKQHTRRDMSMSEFEAITASQKQHHPHALSDETIERLRHFIYFQHPFELTEERRLRAPSRANLHRAPSVRPCPLIPEMQCCPKGEWIAQRFRILKEVNNLKVAVKLSRERSLTPEEREAILKKLSANDRVKFDALRKELAKLGVDPAATFNLERGNRTALNGNAVEHKLAVTFGRSAWSSLPDSQKELLRDGLLHEENSEVLTDMMLRHGADPAKTGKLVGWSPADGYIGYSKPALERLVPLLEQGMNEYQAIEAAFPDRPSSGFFDTLPVLSHSGLPMELNSITNPIVRRALVETRKVVNAVIRAHGKPVKIMVELAREMHQGPEGRKRQSRQRNERENIRQEAKTRVEEYGGNPFSRTDVNRWLLWVEQDHTCIYTSRPIPPTELFQGAEWDVDHILPHWQSLDDSYMNKVLVHRNANADKGDRTPAQWMGSDSEMYNRMLARAQRLVANPAIDFPYGKYQRLQQVDVDTDHFSQRQLNDTRYISKAVVGYLKTLYPVAQRTGERTVQSCRGGLTARLRYQWGLNRVLDDILDKSGNPITSLTRDNIRVKSRADHRHHAIDAVVIALSTRSMLREFQNYYKQQSLPGASEPPMPLPWEFFHDDVARIAPTILVSHRADRKLRGSLHKETFYGVSRDGNGEIEPGLFVTRKSLSALTGKSVSSIRDDAVRAVITNRLRSLGWDGSSNTLPKDWYASPLELSSGTPIRRVRVTVPINNPITLGHRHAISGNNHHMEILALPMTGGTQQLNLVASVIPMMEAASRARPKRGDRKRPVVQTQFDDGMQFVMSLGRKETVRLKNPANGQTTYCVVQKIAGSVEPSSTIDLYLRDVRDSRPASEGNKTPFVRLNSFLSWTQYRIEKIQVDPLGRCQVSGD